MKLISRVSYITIADKVFFSGDQILLNSTVVDLGENQRSSTCSFSIYDKGLKIGGEFQTISLMNGGILVPDELLKDPNAGKPNPTGTTDTSDNTLQTSGGGNVEANIQLIVAECIKQGVTDKNQIAYILATAQHESGYTPIDEIDGKSAPYAPYFGRGFAQLTHKENYAKYSKLLGRDFVKNPDEVKEPTVSAFIIVHGMKTGHFTGAKLSDFISYGKKDYYNARTIVNSHDRADLIKQYAETWESKLDKYLGKTGSMSPVEKSPTGGEATPSADVQETSIKGTEIIINLGFGFSKFTVAFHFIHTKTESKRDGSDITTFSGQSVRWVLSRVPMTTSYEQLTLQQLAQKFSRDFGLAIKMTGEGSKYKHLDQTELTPYQLLSREAAKIGFRIADDTKNSIILEPEGKPIFRNFVIDETTLISITFTDTARGSKGIPYQAISDPYTSSREAKFTIDKKSGNVVQTSPETTKNVPKSSAATTGKSSGVSGITEQNAKVTLASAASEATENKALKNDPPKVVNSETITNLGVKITRQVSEQTVKKPGEFVKTVVTIENKGGVENKSTVITTRKLIYTDVDTISGTETKVRKDVNGLITEETTTSTEIDGDLEESLGKGTAIAGSDNYGLPKQIPGVIALETGKIQGEVIADESKRIKGYESVARLVTMDEVLQIVPGEIIGISGNLFPEPFNREWRVSNIRHDWGAGVSTLSFYTPQGLAEDDKKPTEDGEASSETPGNLDPSGWAPPMKTVGNSVLKPTGEYGYARGRLHKGIDIGGYGVAPDPDAVFAAHSGKVIFAGEQSGYGNRIEILKSDGWKSSYNHLAFKSVKVGDIVKIGQKIGVRGNSGGNYEIHLHFEVFDPSGMSIDPRKIVPGLPA